MEMSMNGVCSDTMQSESYWKRNHVEIAKKIYYIYLYEILRGKMILIYLKPYLMPYNRMDKGCNIHLSNQQGRDRVLCFSRYIRQATTASLNVLSNSLFTIT